MTNTPFKPCPDAVEAAPMLLEVLNFIEYCRSLQVISGGSEAVNKAVERENIRLKADKLYKKLDAVKWGATSTPPAQKEGV